MRQVTENTLTRSWQKFRENNLHYLKNTVQKMKNLSHQKNISSNQLELICNFFNSLVKTLLS